MTTEQYETHRYGNSAFVVALSWYAVFTLLCHSAIILIVPKLSVNVLHTPWYKHSTALRYAMMVWILHWIIEFIEAFAKSNYFTYVTNYLIICTIRTKFQSVMFALTTIITFFAGFQFWKIVFNLLHSNTHQKPFGCSKYLFVFQ